MQILAYFKFLKIFYVIPKKIWNIQVWHIKLFGLTSTLILFNKICNNINNNENMNIFDSIIWNFKQILQSAS